MLGPTGHEDTFTRDNLPPAELWPEIRLEGFDYPDWLNAGVELSDRMVERGLAITPRLSGTAGFGPTRNWPTGRTASPMHWSRITA